jgi:hypothetical protein
LALFFQHRFAATDADLDEGRSSIDRPRLEVMVHDGTRADDRALTDGHTWKNHNTGKNQGVRPNFDALTADSAQVGRHSWIAQAPLQQFSPGHNPSASSDPNEIVHHAGSTAGNRRADGEMDMAADLHTFARKNADLLVNLAEVSNGNSARGNKARALVDFHASAAGFEMLPKNGFGEHLTGKEFGRDVKHWMGTRLVSVSWVQAESSAQLEKSDFNCKLSQKSGGEAAIDNEFSARDETRLVR